MEDKKKEKRARRLKELYEIHGWKINLPSSQLEPEDKASFNGSLRCFGKVWIRDDFGNKIVEAPKRRCGNGVMKGSLFCKKCGGNNSYALVHGNNTSSINIYRSGFKNNTGDLFQAFLDDPAIGDLRPELAALRTLAVEYIGKLTGKKEEKSLKNALKAIKSNLENETLSSLEKFVEIRNVCFSNLSLTDGECIDRLVKLCDAIGRTVERIEKVQNKAEFVLTPDGIKVLFRCIVDILKKNINDEVLKSIKEELLTINVKTKGSLTNYDYNTESAIKRSG